MFYFDGMAGSFPVCFWLSPADLATDGRRVEWKLQCAHQRYFVVLQSGSDRSDRQVWCHRGDEGHNEVQSFHFEIIIQLLVN